MKQAPRCSQHVFVTVKIISASGKTLVYATQNWPAHIDHESASQLAERIIKKAEEITK